MRTSKGLRFAILLCLPALALITFIVMGGIDNKKSPVIFLRNRAVSKAQTKEVKTPPKKSQKTTTVDMRMSRVTTAANMSVSVFNRSHVYQVADTLLLKIVARDANGRPKSYGQDFMVAKVYTESPIKACTGGRITDYGNGTYIARFLLSWPGNLAVSVKLIHSSEAVQVLRSARDLFSDRRITYCRFLDKKSNISEWTRCTFDPNSKMNPTKICDFSQRKQNVTWVCQKPKDIHCDFMVACKNNREVGVELLKKMITDEDALLFNSSRVNQEIPNDLRITVERSHNPDPLKGRHLPPCGPRLPETTSEGYWYNNSWNSLRCHSHQSLSSLSIYKCLQNKTFLILGDSTARQYYTYLKQFDDSIKIDFIFHNFPRTHDSNYIKSLSYAADMIDRVVGGPNVVVILSIWAHYTALPLETFRSRVYGIRHAIERLHKKYPDTKVIWRTGNLREHKILVHFLHNSNWFAYQLVLEAKRILSGLNIFIMDVWEMSICTNYLVHPEPNVIKNHIDLIFSYICPGFIKDLSRLK
ncbi:NXPE family member 3-like [Branchiostoma floridae]|uniref:NXPE family member 3-like n=1 Tax=Branchiostoma floridae TaxID=7739 RepID=A0A9J7KL59_BRAFL|nr:NXPE family member 3-like [Branchiostoma floridae]XP_035665393.1 NXPE family member 3-like [Branchiostoma floridae]XP_035665394.1 NXPE family member 3-like [Branchiostoma floridae]